MITSIVFSSIFIVQCCFFHSGNIITNLFTISSLKDIRVLQ